MSDVVGGEQEMSALDRLLVLVSLARFLLFVIVHLSLVVDHLSTVHLFIVHCRCWSLGVVVRAVGLLGLPRCFVCCCCHGRDEVAIFWLSESGCRLQRLGSRW